MSVSPKGLSIQSLYRDYRDGKLVINRQYQRKLVWTISEKQKLIQSILYNYPIPLILLAEKKVDGESITEVIDGMQRLNAIFSFIEHSFLVDNKCFDLNEFARARQAKEESLFVEYSEDVTRLTASVCADFLDYQLAITSFPGEDEERITDIFGRINSGGKQLSDQERRQAGVLSELAKLTRDLAAELRGDVSKDKLPLFEMPEISIETQKNPHGYKLKAEDIFWCKQGILRTSDLRDSDDEEMIIDICASILKGQPVEGTGTYRDSLYTVTTDTSKEMERLLVAYGPQKIADEVKVVFSAVRTVVETANSEPNFFRKTVYPKPTSNAQKSPFYAVYMAFFDLIIKESMYPDDSKKIMSSLKNLTNSISVGQKQTNAKDRKQNVDKTKGLLRDYFVKSDVSTFKHGAGVALDFENSITRSKTESSRYEFKQGFLQLNKARNFDGKILQNILETICAIANCGPDADGYLYIGIADKKEDAERIVALDKIDIVTVRHVNIVGVEREASILNKSLDNYMRILTDFIQKSQLSEPLKTMMASSIDSVTYKNLEVIRVRIPKQQKISFVGDYTFFRSGPNTLPATGPQIAALTTLFK